VPLPSLFPLLYSVMSGLPLPPCLKRSPASSCSVFASFLHRRQTVPPYPVPTLTEAFFSRSPFPPGEALFFAEADVVRLPLSFSFFRRQRFLFRNQIFFSGRLFFPRRPEKRHPPSSRPSDSFKFCPSEGSSASSSFSLALVLFFLRRGRRKPLSRMSRFFFFDLSLRDSESSFDVMLSK